MMKSIFLFLCMATSTVMLGQNVASNGLQMQLFEVWVDGAWQNSVRGTYTSNADGYINHRLMDTWNAETSSWVLNRQVTYSTEGTTQISIDQNWDGDSWVNNIKTSWFYEGGSENATSDLLQTWEAGAWKNVQHTTNTYNEEGYLIHSLYKTWNAETSEWQISSQQNYTINDIGQTIFMMQQLYIPASETWMDYQSQTNSYTAGFLTYILYEVNIGEWINSGDTVISYDEQQRQYQTILHYWNSVSNDWDNGMRTTNYYETLGTDAYKNSALAVYPNPASSIISVSGVEPLQSVAACAIDGKSFFLSHANNQIDVSALPAGIYVLTAETGSGRQNVTFIKQ